MKLFLDSKLAEIRIDHMDRWNKPQHILWK